MTWRRCTRRARAWKRTKEAERLYKSAADKGRIGAGKAGEWLKSYKRAELKKLSSCPFLLKDWLYRDSRLEDGHCYQGRLSKIQAYCVSAEPISFVVISG